MIQAWVEDLSMDDWVWEEDEQEGRAGRRKRARKASSAGVAKKRQKGVHDSWHGH